MTKQQQSVPLKESHKNLYGLLMLANERVDNAGFFLIWILLTGAIALCVTIHMRWVNSVAGIPVDNLRGIGVYALVTCLAFLLFIVTVDIREIQAYRAFRPRIVQALKEHGICLETLLVDIADDDELKEIRQQLMKDKSLLQEKFSEHW